jgi:hypothetical protein
LLLVASAHLLAMDFRNPDNPIARRGVQGTSANGKTTSKGRLLMVDRRIVTTSGVERVLDGTVIDKFASALRGDLIAIDNPDYNAVRKVWNGLVDKRPALIARCTGTADVIACVRFAREHDLLISVRGGGHSAGGRAVCEKGLTIDLSLMKGIRVDPTRQTVRAEPGLRLGEFDQETQAFGLATTLGVVTIPGLRA